MEGLFLGNWFKKLHCQGPLVGQVLGLVMDRYGVKWTGLKQVLVPCFPNIS